MMSKSLKKYYKHIYELLKADEEDMCFILPCKNWLDIVFGNNTDFYYIDEYDTIRNIKVDNTNRIAWRNSYKDVYLMGYDDTGNYIEFLPTDIGLSIFFTEEEAKNKKKGDNIEQTTNSKNKKNNKNC